MERIELIIDPANSGSSLCSGWFLTTHNFTCTVIKLLLWVSPILPVSIDAREQGSFTGCPLGQSFKVWTFTLQSEEQGSAQHLVHL